MGEVLMIAWILVILAMALDYGKKAWTLFIELIVVGRLNPPLVEVLYLILVWYYCELRPWRALYECYYIVVFFYMYEAICKVLYEAICKVCVKLQCEEVLMVLKWYCIECYYANEKACFSRNGDMWWWWTMMKIRWCCSSYARLEYLVLCHESLIMYMSIWMFGWAMT